MVGFIGFWVWFGCWVVVNMLCGGVLFRYFVDGLVVSICLCVVAISACWVVVAIVLRFGAVMFVFVGFLWLVWICLIRVLCVCVDDSSWFVGACGWMWLFGWIWVSLDWLLCLLFYWWWFMLLNCCYLLFVRLPWWGGRVLVCSLWFNSVVLFATLLL